MSHCSATRGLLETDHETLNHGQVTGMTPELAPPPLLTTTPHQREDVSALDRFNVHRCPTRGRLEEESGRRGRNWSDVTRARREERRKGGIDSPKLAVESGPMCVKYVEAQTFRVGVKVRRVGYQLRCHTHHLVMVQNYEDRRQMPSSS
ncbi:uncharacterized protein TNCV_2751861 [Trichonephila clavipes]|nr:uncharacterized protein TNCV_2751861 [Trichonephila clavipes]